MSSKERFKLIVDVYAFFIRDGKILLTRRCNTGYHDGEYGIVAGHLEPGETVTQGVIREAKEEADVTLLSENLEVVHVMHRREDDARIGVFFFVKKWPDELRNSEPEKCDEFLWTPIDALPDTTIHYVRSAIEQYLAGNTFSEFGWEQS